MTIEETLQIALDAHKGQKDLDGKPADYSGLGLNVPLVAVCNVPPIAFSNVPPQKWLL